MDLAGVEVEIDLLEGDDAGKPLGEVAGFEERGFVGKDEG
jgi:hypothetical protein